MIINYLITKVDAKREDNIPPETQMGISNNITVLDVEKVLDDSITEEVLQISLNISIIEAMSLSKMLQLPSILPLPKVSTEKKDEKKEKQGNKEQYIG